MTPAAALAHSNPAPGAAPGERPADAPSPARARIEQRMAALARLVEIGMEIAESCGRDARAAAAATAATTADEDASLSPDHRRDFGLVFARTARAVRLTIALESRLAADLADLDRADARAEQSRRDDRRIRLSRLVEQAARAGVEAQRQAGGRYWSGEDAIEAEIDRLADDAYERLTEAEDGESWGGSFEEVVAAVCRDLGLSPDWAARLKGAVEPPGGRPAPHNASPVAAGDARGDCSAASDPSPNLRILPCEAGEDGAITPAAPASAPPRSGSP